MKEFTLTNATDKLMGALDFLSKLYRFLTINCKEVECLVDFIVISNIYSTPECYKTRSISI